MRKLAQGFVSLFLKEKKLEIAETLHIHTRPVNERTLSRLILLLDAEIKQRRRARLYSVSIKNKNTSRMNFWSKHDDPT